MGRPLMPLLFAVGQHQALEAVKGHFSDGDHLLAYLDTFIVTQPGEHWGFFPESGNRVVEPGQDPNSWEQDQNMESGRHPTTNLRRT